MPIKKQIHPACPLALGIGTGACPVTPVDVTGVEFLPSKISKTFLPGLQRNLQRDSYASGGFNRDETNEINQVDHSTIQPFN